MGTSCCNSLLVCHANVNVRVPTHMSHDKFIDIMMCHVSAVSRVGFDPVVPVVMISVLVSLSPVLQQRVSLFCSNKPG